MIRAGVDDPSALDPTQDETASDAGTDGEADDKALSRMRAAPPIAGSDHQSPADGLDDIDDENSGGGVGDSGEESADQDGHPAEDGGKSDKAMEAPEAEEEVQPLSVEELERAIEAVLFATAEPLTVRQLAELFEVSVHDIREAIENLRTELEDGGRSFRLQEVAGGLQLLTQSEYHPWISRLLRKRREQRLSSAALETLAVIAYKQPMSKATLEDIRGVGCAPILKTLMDRGLIKIVGREETLGRPLLYGSTDLFLESFGLASLKSLPQPEIDAKDE